VANKSAEALQNTPSLRHHLRLAGQRPRDEPDINPRVVGTIDLAFEPIGGAITAADQALTTCIAPARHKRPAADACHRRQ